MVVVAQYKDSAFIIRKKKSLNFFEFRNGYPWKVNIQVLFVYVKKERAVQIL